MPLEVLLSLLHNRTSQADSADQVVEPSLPKLLLMLSGGFFLSRAEVVRDQSDVVDRCVLEDMRRWWVPLDYRLIELWAVAYASHLGGWASPASPDSPLRPVGIPGYLTLVRKVLLPSHALKKARAVIDLLHGAAHLSGIPLRHVRLLVPHACLALGLRKAASDSLPSVVVVEGGRSHAVAVETHRLRLLQDASERIDQVVVVLVRLEDVKAGKDELVLFLDQLVKQLDIVRVAVEVVPG